MKKGLMQIQTIIYVIFAIVILMAGVFSVQSYLSGIKIDTTYELSNMDVSLMGKRIIASDRCFINLEEINSISDTGKEYSILDVDQGNLVKSKISLNADSCFTGFSKTDYKVKFYDLNPKTEFYSWGDAECEPKLELLVRFGNSLGLVEVCSDA